MSKNLVVILSFSFLLSAVLGGLFGYSIFLRQDAVTPNVLVNKEQIINSEPKDKKVKLPEAPTRKVLNSDYHAYQTFNNCGPAALSMMLSYYGINISQYELGQDLRPYQNPKGDNDDKSVTLEELANRSESYGLVPYHRPNGNVEIIKSFISNDIPVLARTWLKKDEDIGHYRVVKGYNNVSQVFIQDDSLQGKNLEYVYDDFIEIWKPFSFEYLVLVPKDKIEIAENILGKNVDEDFAWQESLKTWQNELKKNPNDVNARFNLSIAYFHIGKYQESVNEFEKIEFQLPSRALWYQIEPVLAYYELKDYDRVFSVTNKIINNHNRAFSELYLIRGGIYKERGDIENARIEYQKAVQYNKNLQEARNALESI